MKKINEKLMRISVLVFCFVYPVLAGFVHADSKSLSEENTEFAFDLYRNLKETDGNLFFSPYSISTALAMTYAGARGETEKQMQRVLNLPSASDQVHQDFSSLIPKQESSQGLKLHIANSLWPQKDYPFLPEYTSLLEKYYGVSIRPVDYRSNVETSRKMINEWVEQKTENKIQALIKPGILDSLTRLVLVNAIYFKGNWRFPFVAKSTKEADFHVNSSKKIQVPMMVQQNHLKHAEIGSLQILELPYAESTFSMILILPKDLNGLASVESELSASSLGRWKEQLREKEIMLRVPKFSMSSFFQLEKILAKMGMTDAFLESKADFSGMDGKPHNFFVGAAIHKSFIEVNEEGTEAAAATAVMMAARGLPRSPPSFTADHPFLFVIQDRESGSILFIGRVVDPTIQE